MRRIHILCLRSIFALNTGWSEHHFVFSCKKMTMANRHYEDLPLDKPVIMSYNPYHKGEVSTFRGSEPGASRTSATTSERLPWRKPYTA